MDTPNTTLDIKQLSTQLLENHTDGALVKSVLDEIHQLFTNKTNFSGLDGEISHLAALPTAMGMAVSINEAALCLLDYRRTVQFLRGITAAIKDKQKEFPGETINIFYAGCGPYAPFVTLVAPLFTPEEVQFTVLEISGESIALAETLVKGLGLTKYVDNFYSGDAVLSEVPDADKYHILFSETLDTLLFRESYVPILWNMIPQFNENVIVLPENVILKSSFGTFVGEELTETESITVFDTRQELKDHGVEALPDNMPSKIIPIPAEMKGATIIIDTEVVIYGDIKLIRNESDISVPQGLDQDPGTDFKQVKFTYQIRPTLMLLSIAE